MAIDLLIGELAIVATATVALLAVMLLRLPARGLFGARAAYCLWLIVPAMTVCTLLPRTPISVPIPIPTLFEAQAQLSDLGARANAGHVAVARIAAMPRPAQLAWPLTLIWAFGALAYAALVVRGHRRFLATLGPLRVEDRPDGRVFHASGADHGPALIGGMFPRLIVPVDFVTRFSAAEQDIVIAHERMHGRGGDAQINLLIVIFRALFWFHPLAHVAARLIRIDQELACDETVIARNPGARRLYAEAMLKAQLGGVPVQIGCHWRPGNGSELRRRIVRLSRTPERWRRALGSLTAAAMAVAGGAMASSMQPVPAEPVAPALKPSASGERVLAATGPVAAGASSPSRPVRLARSPDSARPSLASRPDMHRHSFIIPGEARTPRYFAATPADRPVILTVAVAMSGDALASPALIGLAYSNDLATSRRFSPIGDEAGAGQAPVCRMYPPRNRPDMDGADPGFEVNGAQYRQLIIERAPTPEKPPLKI